MSNANWQTQLTVLEKNTFLDFFKQVDADNKGIVLQDEAMEFLKKSDIPQNILLQFWNATDNDRKGFLTEEEFCIILKLIACAQHGIMTSEPILATKAPLPDFTGNGSANNHQMSNTPQQQYQSLSSQPADIVSPEDRIKYMNLFQSFGPENNLLSGERARTAFVRSNLPPAILQAIWNLADTRKSGTLNQTEFIIAMFYIERAMKGLTNLPTSLPANVYASATGRSVPPSPLVRNNTLQVHSPPPVPMRSPVFKGATRATVDIAPEEYAKYKTFFHQLDTDQSGYVSGADAVVFFRHSKLPESDLARIWDLADTNSTGQLNEQEFAMAMHMINRRVSGGEIPNSLPAFNSFAEPPQQQSQNVDLLGLNADFTGVPASANTPQPQFNNNDSLQRTYSTLQSNTTSELTRAQTAQSQFHNESQAIQELERQIEQQKESLAKMKHEADEAERQLEAERKRKEELTKELQMYKQEAKHFATRIENAQQETAKLREENAALEKEKSTSQPATAATAVSLDNAHDFFSLSSAPSTANNGLFAKVTEPTTSSPVATQATPSSTLSSPQQSNAFDPFAGFKASQQQQQQSSPIISINKLKQETELKRSVTPNVDISDIESKFPDLNTMEQSFAAPASPPVSSPAPAAESAPAVQSPSGNDLYSNLFASASPSLQRSTTSAVKSDHGSNSLARSATSALKKDPKSKYGFDLSAFETTSSTSTPFGESSSTSMKDELSSLFGSPTANTTSLPKSNNANSGFDDIFGNTTTTTANNPNSFEDIFSQK